MANLLNIKEHLKYCGNNCANIAIYKVNLVKRGISENSKITFGYRCENHKLKGSCDKKVLDYLPYNQSEKLNIINEFLKTLINKNIHSNFHTAKELKVKYLKENGGVMCFQEYSKKWKYVYYNQIDSVL